MGCGDTIEKLRVLSFEIRSESPTTSIQNRVIVFRFRESGSKLAVKRLRTTSNCECCIVSSHIVQLDIRFLHSLSTRALHTPRTSIHTPHPPLFPYAPTRPPFSGGCVKSLRSSYTGLYPQDRPPPLFSTSPEADPSTLIRDAHARLQGYLANKKPPSLGPYVDSRPMPRVLSGS